MSESEFNRLVVLACWGALGWVLWATLLARHLGWW
jgi:hypothetical protein